MEKISFIGQKIILSIMTFFLAFVLMIGGGVLSYLFFLLGQWVSAIIATLFTIALLILTGFLAVQLLKKVYHHTSTKK